MSNPIDFLFLSEEEVVQAGVLDTGKCISVMEEVFHLLSEGDYVMGGPTNNSHGIEMNFPKHPIFSGMPHHSPDRRFLALIAYLGGRFRIAGQKWYGSNIDNKSKGLPRSILTVMLNDADTGAPLALMAGNLISSTRTGAVPAVAAKYLLNKSADTIGIVGSGVMGKTTLYAVLEIMKNVKEIKLYDIFSAAAEDLASCVREKTAAKISIVSSIDEAVAGSDFISVATSGETDPYLNHRILKSGAVISMPATIDMDEEFILNTRLVADNWGMFEEWYRDNLVSEEFTFEDEVGQTAAFVMEAIQDGRLPREHVINLGDVVTGKIKARRSEDEPILFTLGGMGVEDVAWGYTIYEKAKELGLGQTLRLWNEPYRF